jgi:hypothetical protein
VDLRATDTSRVSKSYSRRILTGVNSQDASIFDIGVRRM